MSFFRTLAFVALAALLPTPSSFARGFSPPAGDGGRAGRGAENLVDIAESHLGQGNFIGLAGPWCAWAISAWLRTIGRPPLASGMASSALTYGPHLSAPKAGALVVLRGHVGIVARVNADGSIQMVSGNWSRKVKEARIARYQVVAFIGIP